MKHTSIKRALQHVADYPGLVDDDIMQMPVHELVSRVLFDVANSYDQTQRGSATRANKARKIILDRLGGKRMPGTDPVVKQEIQLQFKDLSGHVLDDPEEAEDLVL